MSYDQVKEPLQRQALMHLQMWTVNVSDKYPLPLPQNKKQTC